MPCSPIGRTRDARDPRMRRSGRDRAWEMPEGSLRSRGCAFESFLTYGRLRSFEDFNEMIRMEIRARYPLNIRFGKCSVACVKRLIIRRGKIGNADVFHAREDCFGSLF